MVTSGPKNGVTIPWPADQRPQPVTSLPNPLVTISPVCTPIRARTCGAGSTSRISTAALKARKAVVLVRDQQAEHRNASVTDELLDRPPVPLDDRLHSLEVAREHRLDRLGIGRLTQLQRPEPSRSPKRAAVSKAPPGTRGPRRAYFFRAGVRRCGVAAQRPRPPEGWRGDQSVRYPRRTPPTRDESVVLPSDARPRVFVLLSRRAISSG